jgi:hypothetical protein
VQVAKLIASLGQGDSGRRAILRAIGAQQGIGEDEIEKIMAGTSDTKLRIPEYLRPAMLEAGLADVIVPRSIMPILIKERDGLMPVMGGDEWSDLEFEVALDSGAVVHVCSPSDCPGYVLEESAGSKRGQQFLMGDGGEIPNLGQKSLNLSDSDGKKELRSVFQIAAVTRPLMSVGKICDEGHKIAFDKLKAVVTNAQGAEICRFERSPHGGLYVAKLKLRNPLGFTRQE